MNEHVDYQVKHTHKGTKFLWWCAGADARILKYSSYADHVKYVGIGGVVLATGFLAMISMGFAMHTIFGDDKGQGNWFITIPIAIIWGLIIFNLDRFIVSSTGKGDGKSSISWEEFKNALPRLSMAIILGLSIAAPLETYIFQTEIQREWNLTMEQLAQGRLIQFETKENTRREELDEALIKVEDEVQNQQRIAEEAAKEFIIQMQGKNGAVPGYGAKSKKLEELKIQEENLLKKLLSSRDSIRLKIENNNVRIDEAKDSIYTSTINSRPGFLDKLMMLERLAEHGKSIPKYDPVTNEVIQGEEVEIYGSAFWPVWLVRLLLMMVEIAPVLLKLMLIKGPYDYMSENVNQILETKQGIGLRYITDENSQIHKMKENYNPQRISAIVDYQNKKEVDNAKKAIDEYSKEEESRIKKNPGSYFEDQE
jgi:hypothetical protein